MPSRHHWVPNTSSRKEKKEREVRQGGEREPLWAECCLVVQLRQMAMDPMV